MSLREQIINDAKALHNELQRLEIGAVIDKKRCVPGGEQLAFYGVRLIGKTPASSVTKALPDLMRALTRSRKARTNVRFDEVLLRLEAEHPRRKALDWMRSVMSDGAPHSATLGKAYQDGEYMVGFSFDEVPQVLVAGETGSGKTVLLRNLITSLCFRTSPRDLRIILVDPKNEDLRPYANLPHVIAFAGRTDEITAAVDYVSNEVQRRIDDPSRKPYRLMLIVDELAQLTQIDGAIKKLGSIMSIGRSKLINAVVCTQQPTEEGGMGSMMKANVPLRLIGPVSAGQSYTATRRKNAGADMLPTKQGAFLFIHGQDMYRFNTFLLTDGDERRASAIIGDRWSHVAVDRIDLVQGKKPKRLVVAPVVDDEFGDLPPVATGGGTGGDWLYTSENAADDLPVATGGDNRSAFFPIKSGRALTAVERDALRRMAASGDYDWRGEPSISALCREVYGCKDGDRLQWVREALADAPAPDKKIIQLRRAS